MPFYEYECTACKFYVEALQKISEPPLRECPSCKKQSLKRLVSAPVFRLKGGGWYETDFKSDQEGKRHLAQREEPAETKEAQSEAGETAKPAAEAKPSEAPPEKAQARKSVTVKSPVKAAKSARPKAKAKAPAKKKRTSRR